MVDKISRCCKENLNEFFDDFIPEQLDMSIQSTAKTIADIIVNLDRGEVIVGLGLKESNLSTCDYVVNVALVNKEGKRIVHINTIPILLCFDKGIAEKVVEKLSELINDEVETYVEDMLRSSDFVNTKKRTTSNHVSKSSPSRILH